MKKNGTAESEHCAGGPFKKRLVQKYLSDELAELYEFQVHILL
jgi:hypothetical protein